MGDWSPTLFGPRSILAFSVVMEHISMSPEDIDSALQLALVHASTSPTTSAGQQVPSSFDGQAETHIPGYSQAETLMSTQEANEPIQARQFAQGNLQGKLQDRVWTRSCNRTLTIGTICYPEHQENAAPGSFISPTPSQAETLMSTQDAKERAEARTAAKGKGREEQGRCIHTVLWALRSSFTTCSCTPCCNTHLC